MPDFNSFNPDNARLGAQFNAQQRKKGAEKPEVPQSSADSVADPYADLKVSPDVMFGMLAAQAKQNIPNLVSNSSIEKNVAHFSGTVSSTDHAQVTAMISDVYQQEFGKAPSATLLRAIVDNYLIGTPSVQQAV